MFLVYAKDSDWVLLAVTECSWQHYSTSRQLCCPEADYCNLWDRVYMFFWVTTASLHYFNYLSENKNSDNQNISRQSSGIIKGEFPLLVPAQYCTEWQFTHCPHLSSLLGPTHTRPPCRGDGLLQDRWRNSKPVPQDVLHCPHDDQGVQPPFL